MALADHADGDRAAAEPPPAAKPTAPPPFRVPRTAGEGDRRHRRSVHPGARPPLPPRHRSHAALSAMLARRPLTLRPPPPTLSRVRGSRCPPARAPHCGPAPPGAPGDRGSSGSDSFRRSPSAAAGGSRSRPTPPGEERAAGGTGPIPKPPRQSPPRFCPPAAPPPFPGTTTIAARPSLHCPESQVPGRGKPLTLPPAAGDHGRSGPVRSLGWASPPLPSLTFTTSPTGGESPRTPARAEFLKRDVGTYSRNTGGGSGAFQGHRLRGRPAGKAQHSAGSRGHRRRETEPERAGGCGSGERRRERGRRAASERAETRGEKKGPSPARFYRAGGWGGTRAAVTAAGRDPPPSPAAPAGARWPRQ
ncbi:basic proline-rich protein-like [Motacilla alba alba]|uniref:basic proline-rich protein-like n=1 Tax=Motacilla alba alba TaxID=1094192 RepID=UPI0018D55784|nr:basic proline-rich protein-like [Motacilla alba alba]